MNIIIVGCGKVGETLAQQLGEEGNNITVVDTDAERVNTVAAKYDVMGCTGNGATHLTLKEAGIDSANLLIAVTGSDELNLLCCIIAKKAGGCKTIARVRSPQYNSEASYLKSELGLAMVINPEFAAASEIARVLRFPSAMKIDTFARGRVEMMKFRLPEGSPLVGCAVKELAAKFRCDVLICTVERENDAIIANGDLVFEEKDVISFIAPPKNAIEFFRKIDYKLNSVKSVMIVGGGDISYYLCQILRRSGNIAVKVIEKNPHRCDELCSELEDAMIINGDASEQALLAEEGLDKMGAFVALTNLDEENIFLSLFAKRTCNGKLVTKINRIDFDDVIRHLDLDTIIYPKNLTAETIVRYVRAMKNTIGSNMETLYHIVKGKIEAAEFTIKEGSPVIGKPLMELKFNCSVLIAAILRGKQVIVPRGHDTMQQGDSVVIVTNHTEINDITDVLK